MRKLKIIGIFSLVAMFIAVAWIGLQKIKNLETLKQNQNVAEIENLRKEIETLKNQKPQVVIKENSLNQEIKASEISQYLTGVGLVWCGYDDGSTSGGSGSLILNNTGQETFYAVLTNDHVIRGARACSFLSEAGLYNLDINTTYEWNTLTDVAVLRIGSPIGNVKTPMSQLNYKISSLPLCSNKMLLGSPIVVIGYPAFTQTSINVEGIGEVLRQERTVNNGVISAYDSSVVETKNLPYANYYVSAKVDSGNSGGIALSKESGVLCKLGIPTWLSIGNFETQGLIQNLHNIIYIPDNKFGDLFKDRESR